MDLVNGDRLIEAVVLAAALHPFAILPRVVEIPDDRGEFRRYFVEEGKRIGLLDSIMVRARDDVVLVEAASPHVGKEPFPDTGVPFGSKRMRVFSPTVEIAHDKKASDADLVLWVLSEVETNATTLLPILVEGLASTNTVKGAAYGLARIGMVGLPPLIIALTNAEPLIRLAAEVALDSDYQKSISGYGSNPRRTFQQRTVRFNLSLQRATRRSDWDPKHENAAKILCRYTNDANPMVREAANLSLNHVGQLTQ